MLDVSNARFSQRNREEYPDHHHTRSAPSPEAPGPARRVDALRRASRPHHLVRGMGGVVRRGGSVGAEQARSRTPSRRRRGAIRRLDGRRFSGAQAWPAPAHHARIRLCDGRTAGGASARWWRAQSLNRARLWTGRGAGSRLWAAWSGSALVALGFATRPSRGVLAFGRGQKQRRTAHARGRSGGQP